METLLIVEVLDRGGEVLDRHKLDRLPVKIGRAYSNEIIVDDHYVCPEHLNITNSEDGKILIEDLKSVNGLFRKEENNPISSLTIDTSVTVVIGQTHLRLFVPSVIVPPAIRQPRHSLALDKPLVSISLFISYIAFYIVAWLVFENSSKLSNGQILTATLTAAGGVLASLVFWSICWSVPSKIIRKRAYFSTHFSISLIASFALQGILSIVAYGSFIFGIAKLGWIIWGTIGALIFSGMFYYHLQFASRLKPKARKKISALIFTLPVTVMCLIAFGGDFGFSNSVRFGAEVKPVSLRLSRGVSPEVFIASTSSLKESLDKQKIE